MDARPQVPQALYERPYYQFFFFYNWSKCALKFSLLCLPFGMSGLITLKKFAYLEVFYELLSISLNIYRWLFLAWYVLNPVFCSKIAHLHVARTTKSCSQRQKLLKSCQAQSGQAFSYFDTLLRYLLSVTFCGAAVLNRPRHTRLARLKWKGTYNCVTCRNTCCDGEFARQEFIIHKSLIGNNLPLFLSLWGYKTVHKQGRQVTCYKSTSCWAERAFLGREAADRATKSWEVDLRPPPC